MCVHKSGESIWLGDKLHIAHMKT